MVLCALFIKVYTLPQKSCFPLVPVETLDNKFQPTLTSPVINQCQASIKFWFYLFFYLTAAQVTKTGITKQEDNVNRGQPVHTDTVLRGGLMSQNGSKHLWRGTMGVWGPWVSEKSSFSRRNLLLNHYILLSFSPAACVTTHLHSNDGVDEEQHGNEQADIWQSLKTNRKTG